ncbi:MAG: phytoene/squalene synthase family protein [Bdellovibrionota bacterium]
MSAEAEVFNRNAKTFSFASRFFEKKTRSRIETMYEFFRWADDLAEKLDSESRAELESTQKLWLKAKNDSRWARVQQLFDEIEVDEAILNVFFECMLNDQSSVRLKSDQDLMRYCFGAAATVGLCLAKTFEVSDARAFLFAIDLGMAMQLTNIVRDIDEDYENDKIYLPELCEKPPSELTDQELRSLKLKYIEIADQFYESAQNGFRFLDFRARFCVGLASKLYRQIGHYSLKSKFLRKRAYTNRFQKLFLLSLYVFEFFKETLFPRSLKEHDKNLHKDLQGLPYVL